MKIRNFAQAGIAAILLSGTMHTAQAVTQYARATIYFDTNEQIIGQSMINCDSLGQHSGSTSGVIRVTITYTCGWPTDSTFGKAKSVAWTTNASATLRANFCSLYAGGICDYGPEPLSEEYVPWPWVGGYN